MDPPEVTYAGHRPGVIGKITELHAVYYHQHWGFDLSFEAQVGEELSRFLSELAPDRDTLLTAWAAGEFAGAVAIDGHSTPDLGARLRWFIVRPQFQGLGIGQGLLELALAFARGAGHGRVYLWTFRGLDDARRLYERAGFRLREEHQVRQWGGLIDEQRFDLVLAG